MVPVRSILRVVNVVVIHAGGVFAVAPLDKAAAKSLVADTIRGSEVYAQGVVRGSRNWRRNWIGSRRRRYFNVKVES